MNHLSDHVRQFSRRYFSLQRSLGSVKGSHRQGLASNSDGNRENPFRRPL
jgi:hypothetical protein